MKRSEMISVIANILMDDYPDNCKTHDTGVHCLDQAEVILEAVDKKMIPNSGMIDATGDWISIGDLVDYADIDCSFEWELEEDDDT